MSTLTPEEVTLYTARLAEAEQAYHDLRMGKIARTFVDQNGERVEFAAPNADRLRAYIIELKTMLDLPTGTTGPLNAWVL